MLFIQLGHNTHYKMLITDLHIKLYATKENVIYDIKDIIVHTGILYFIAVNCGRHQITDEYSFVEAAKHLQTLHQNETF